MDRLLPALLSIQEKICTWLMLQLKYTYFVEEQVGKRPMNLRVTLKGCLCNKSIMNIIFCKIVHWMVSCSIIVK